MIYGPVFMNNPTMDKTLLGSHLSLNRFKNRHTWMKNDKEDSIIRVISMTSTIDPIIQVTQSASNSIQKKTNIKKLTKVLTFEEDPHKVMIILKEKCIQGTMQTRVDGDFKKTMKEKVLAEDSSQEIK